LQPIPAGLLAALGQPGTPQGPPGGPPATIQVNPAQHPDNQKLEQQLAPLLDGLRAAMQSPQSDPVIGLDLRKAEMAVAKVIADLHKERQAALGGGPATSFLRRNSGA
jgi:hypothetical protein